MSRSAIENTNICGNHEITKEIAKHLEIENQHKNFKNTQKHRSGCIV